MTDEKAVFDSEQLQDVQETEIESNWDQVVDNFDNMNLKPVK